MKLVYEHDYPKPGEKWKHFKGHVYEIICIAGVDPDWPRAEIKVIPMPDDKLNELHPKLKKVKK